MKTPRKNLKARSAVTSRKSSPLSPGWTAAADVFKSPKSPSPVRRVTRRTSVYQNKPSELGKFKMPLPKIVSPPGVKTRARRSSIYQKGGSRLVSPTKNTRSRRTSMYMSSKSKVETVNVFSKVWATPVRQQETVTETSPKVPAGRKATQKQTTKSSNTSTGDMEENKVKTPGKSASPKKAANTPKAVTKSKTPGRIAKTPKSPNSSEQQQKTPLSCKKAAKTPKAVTKSKTPGRIVKTPKSPNFSKQQKTPSKKDLLPSHKEAKSSGPKSAKRPARKSSPENKAKPVSQPVLLTSTPTKSLEQISGKSFYSTPGETPIPLKRTDVVFVFSAKPNKSVKRPVKKSVVLTPAETPEKKPKSQKRMPTRKTPAVKRNRERDSIDTDTSVALSPPAKRTRAVPSTRKTKSAKRPEKTLPTEERQETKEKVKLSPVEMTSVLRSVVQTEKRRASESPSPRRSKRAKLWDTDLHTPRVIKAVKRASPKKLAELVSVSQNTNNNGENNESTMNTSLFNNTINTDSRSSRCTIL